VDRSSTSRTLDNKYVREVVLSLNGLAEWNIHRVIQSPPDQLTGCTLEITPGIDFARPISALLVKSE